jgi:O-antigen/teichoic acid export membrane protein
MLIRHPNGYAEIGAFNAASQLSGFLLFLPGVIGQALLPVLSEAMGRNDHVASKRAFASATATISASVGPLVLLGCISSPFLMSVYGAEFAIAWPTLVLLFLTATMLAILAPAATVITASGRMWVALVLNLGWGLAALALTALWIPWGSFGLAAARLCSYVLHCGWTAVFAYHCVRAGKPHQLNGPGVARLFDPRDIRAYVTYSMRTGIE